MKAKVFSLHGQPGSTQDFDRLSDILQTKGIEVEGLNSWSDLLHKRIGANKGCVLVAYSWGCFRALKGLKLLGDRVGKVVLIAPYLKVETPVSAGVHFLVGVPVVSSLLMASYAKKNTAEFLRKTFHPETMPEDKFFLQMKDRLQNHATLWKNAVKAKYTVQNHPLSSSDGCEIQGLAFLGEQDQSAPLGAQLELLKYFPKIQTQIFSGAGHGLLWTQEKVIAERIADFYEQ
jgi:pimeloyl-ACP methyl ester carboxylesterase